MSPLNPQLRDLATGGRPLGSALLWVSASMDGSTLFWANDRRGEALARRWGPADRPWRVALPLEGVCGRLLLHAAACPLPAACWLASLSLGCLACTCDPGASRCR